MDESDVQTRRASDVNLEIIAHKVSRIATEFSEHKRESAAAIDRLEASMRYTHATLNEAIQRSVHAATKAEESAKTSVKEVLEMSFPEGDGPGHRRAHEQWLDERNARREMWAKVRSGLLEKALWSIAAGIVISVAYYLGIGRMK